MSTTTWSYEESRIGDYYPLAQQIARRLAYEEDVDEAVQIGMIDLWKSMLEYARPGKVVGNPKSLAASVLDRSIRWWYKCARGQVTRNNHTSVDSGAIFPELQFDGEDEYYSQLYMEEYLGEVGRLLGPVHQSIASQLLHPSGPVIGVVMKNQRDKAARAAAGERVRGQNTLVVTHQHIRTALGLGEFEWYERLRELRSFSRDFVSERRSSSRAMAPAPA